MSITPEINQFLEQYFDKVLLLSVTRFTDRHRRVEQQLKGLHFDYFWGTDKLTLTEEEISANNLYNDVKARQLQRQGKGLNMGEIACSLSHRSIYAAMVANGWKKILILEDDVMPSLDDLYLLPVTLQELPVDWELVYLGYLKNEKITAGLQSKQFFYKIFSRLGLMKWSYTMIKNLLPLPFTAHLKKAGFHDCTHAYAISLPAAKKLLQAQTPVVYRADDLLSATILKGELKAFITDPKFFDQEIFHNPSLASEIKI